MKTIIKIFICLSLIYTPMFANAANVGGWSLSNSVAQGASTVYDATKNVVINGKNFIKNSSVKITPTAPQVSKVLARGAAGYALSLAVEQLLGAVDWVLDPANNRIKYTDPNASADKDYPQEQYLFRCQDNAIQTNFYAPSPKAACQAYGSSYVGDVFSYYNVTSCSQVSTDYYQCTAQFAYKQNPNNTITSTSNYAVKVANPNYDPDAPPQDREKSIPLEVVAQKVISNAQGGDVNAQVATTAAAADIVAEAEKDDAKARPIASQAEANAETKPADAAEAEKANEAQGQTKPNEANPEATDISLEFPVFCSWAPSVCEAAQVVISFPNTLTGWYTDTKTKAEEWASSIAQSYHDFMRDDELPNDDTKVDITEHPVPELKEDAISWVSSCPADEYVPISLQGVTSTLVLSWSPWCQLLSIIKPAIIASAYIGAAFIVLGIRT